MAADVQVLLRTAESYDVAARAISEMRRHNVWPTPLNFEIWLHALADPDSVLSRELKQVIDSGAPLTEAKSQEFAAAYLPQFKLTTELLSTGDELTRELEGVTDAIAEAQRSSAAYGRALAGATIGIQQGADTPAVLELVRTLAEATRRIQNQNAALEQRLNDSTREVGRLKENLDVVRRDAMTDGLTKLANRKAFDEGLIQAVGQAQTKGVSLALAVIDIDHFKRFNDTWGHQTGDQVIRYVASVLERVGGAPRLAARYGGEEFAMIFPGETQGAANAALSFVLQEIGTRSLKRRSTNDDLGTITVSAGIAAWRHGETPTTLLERADEALYASKRGGRNRITEWEPALAEVA